MDFNFRLERLLHFLLDTSQQERPQNSMQLVNNLLIALLLLRVCFVLITTAQVEPLIKVARRRKDFGQQEVQERPQFMEVVLKRRSG